MATNLHRFEINTSAASHRVKPKRAEFDFVGNGITFALLLAAFLAGYVHFSEHGLPQEVPTLANFIPAGMIEWPWGDIAAALIVGVASFFALKRVKYRLLPALAFAGFTFWALPTPEQVTDSTAWVKAHTGVMTDTLVEHGETIEPLDPVIPFGAEEPASEPKTQLVQHPVIAEPNEFDVQFTAQPPIIAQPMFKPEIEIAAIQPAAGPVEAPVGLTEGTNVSSPLPAAASASDAMYNFGMIEMADGTTVARIQINQEWLTADVRPEAARTAINRFDLLRIGLQPSRTGLLVLPKVTFGEVTLEGVVVKVLNDPASTSVIGYDLLTKLATASNG